MINIRKVGQILDGTVTEIKLATGAVTTEKIADNAVVADKIADSGITEQKIADLAVKTAHLQDNVVTLAKSSDDVRSSHYVGDETDVEVTGVTEVSKKEFRFTKAEGKYKPSKMRLLVSMKTNNVLYAAGLKLYINDEASARATITSNSLTYELKTVEFSIADLNDGIHNAKIKLYSDNAAGIAYNDLMDCLFIVSA